MVVDDRSATKSPGYWSAFVSIALLIELLMVSPATAQQRPRPGQTRPPAADEQAIRAAAQAYAAAYNAGDAKALAALWTVDGDYTDEFGRVVDGREAIEQSFADVFAASPGAKLEIETESIRFLSPDVAIETGVARATPLHGNPTSARYSAIQVKRDGHWLLASVRDSSRIPESNYEYLRGLDWLVGTWQAEFAGQRLRVNIEWIANKNFLLRTYQVEGGDTPPRSGMQVIGWDPHAGQIVSWHFDSDGGFGQDRWHKQGARWFIQSSGVLRDGGETTATNVLSSVEADNCTWQSIERTADGAVLPDTEVLKLGRVASGR